MPKNIISDERKELLKEAKKELDNLSKIITDILDDRLNQKEAAKRLGITPQAFSQDVKNLFIHRLHKCKALQPKQMKALLKEIRTPYEKLTYDIFGIDPDRHGIFLMSDETEKQLEDAIAKYLSKKQTKVIQLWYGIPDNKPMLQDDIANLFGVTRTRIFQIQTNAIRKLRKPHVWNVLLSNYGIVTKTEQEIDILEKCNEELLKQYNTLSKHYQKLQKDNYILTKENVTLEEIQEIINNHDKTILSTSIEELKISVRLRNALHRANCLTLGDVVNQTEDELRHIRNLGDKSVTELLTLLKSIGLEPRNK